jgi:hypothetical protein
LQDKFDVTVGSDTYTFRMPTIRFLMEVGGRSADIRSRAYPEAVTTLNTIDYQAALFARHCAYLELYLIGASTLWPYGIAEDDISKVNMTVFPRVDFDKFPFNRLDDVTAVGLAFEIEVERFRRRGDRSAESTGAQAVADVGHPGTS